MRERVRNFVCVREVRVCVTDTCCVCDRILNNKRDIYVLVAFVCGRCVCHRYFSKN